ncbi:MAG: hypothetical protein ABI910_22110 [Gemmatimonadota bacterium]
MRRSTKLAVCSLLAWGLAPAPAAAQRSRPDEDVVLVLCGAR